MREIRFRAWETRIPFAEKESERSHELVYFELTDLDGDYVIPSGTCLENYTVVEQFTGLKDKDGCDIYEGDIVAVAMSEYLHEHGEDCEQNCSLPLDDEYGHKVTVVEWHRDGGYNLPADELFEDEYSHFLGTSAYTLKVIGNIHENPELLDKTTIA